MSLSEILQVLRRRKFVVVVGVVVSALLAGAVLMQVPNTYSSGATVVLSQPRRIGSASFKIGLGDQPRIFGEDFTVKNVASASVGDFGDHPFLYVTTVGHSPERAVSIVDNLVQAGRDYLRSSQQSRDVKPSNMIQLVTVVDATPPEAVATTRLSLTGVTFLLGLVLTTTLACVVDRRRRRRDAQRAHAEPTPAVEHPDGPADALRLHARPRDTTFVNISRDELHDELTRLGVVLEDTRDGTTWKLQS